MAIGSYITNVPACFNALTLWLDAADSSSITQSGGAVSTWRDKSGNRFNPTQATGSKQPLYTAGLQNGLPGLVFDGTDDILATASNSALMTPESGPMSIFVVSKFISGAYSIGKGRVNSTSGAGGWANTTNLGVVALRAGTSVPAEISGSTAFSIPEPSPTIKGWVFTGSNLTYYNNAAEFGTTKPYSGSVASGQVFTIGGRPTNDNYSACNIFEVILIKAALSDADNLEINQYLANKWGIAL